MKGRKIKKLQVPSKVWHSTFAEIVWKYLEYLLAVGKVINISVKEEDISTSHPLQSYNSDTPSKIILKFTRKDVRNVFYANQRKLMKISTNVLPDFGVMDQENICISESLTPFKRTLFGEVNKV